VIMRGLLAVRMRRGVVHGGAVSTIYRTGRATGYQPLFHASIARLKAMFVLSEVSRR
jgi:hypothetical protein